MIFAPLLFWRIVRALEIEGHPAMFKWRILRADHPIAPLAKSGANVAGLRALSGVTPFFAF